MSTAPTVSRNCEKELGEEDYHGGANRSICDTMVAGLDIEVQRLAVVGVQLIQLRAWVPHNGLAVQQEIIERLRCGQAAMFHLAGMRELPDCSPKCM